MSHALAYHEIVCQPSRYGYSLTQARFEDHLRALAGRDVLFTFDDGLRSQYEYAFPLLEKYSRRGVFFVTVGRIGRPEFMTWSQLRELAAAGHCLAAHGWFHKFLTDCSEAELKEELMRPKKALEDALGKKVDAMSVPGGRWNWKVMRACANSGYSHVHISTMWSPPARFGINICGRSMVRNTMEAQSVLRILDCSPAAMRRQQFEYYAKRGLQAALGNRLYKMAWNVCSGRPLLDHDGI